MVTTCFFGAGCGVIFKLTPQGDFSVLHDFDGTDGESPTALAQGDDGSIYGIAGAGGTGNVINCPSGCGTIFKISPDGGFLVLYNFDGTHGSSPQNLIKASDGTFYGIATLGGANNNGVFFNVTPAGQYTALHDFDFTVVGPYDSIVQASDGNFYGTAVDTGSSCQQGTCSCFAVCGTIFRITPQGSFSVLYNFTDYAQGAEPNSLVQGLDGNFYGAAAGGTADGILFKLNAQGTYSILYNFDRTNGADAPGANGLFRGSDGNLYGTSWDGGVGNAANGCASGCGVIFGFGLNH
jgi:uncharacterized repeat protein (TIGR03803 family)